MAAKVAIIGSGNIGTDLMFKVARTSDVLEVGAMVGIDPDSDGLRRAASMGIPTTAGGAKGLIDLPDFDEIRVIFDATSARAHGENYAALAPHGKVFIDLTPAAIGPFVVPAVNLDENLHVDNVNMVTCGGQATIPMVAAVAQVAPIHYAEIVASISSRSAGPGTRANIDEFTETTARALEAVGGAARGKAIIVLNPAEPPMIMRDTVQAIVDRLDEDGRAAVADSVSSMVKAVAAYVPGYRLKQPVQFADEDSALDGLLPDSRRRGSYTRVSIFLEVEGAAMYLPAYAGTLDIMTSAAVRAAEALVLARAGRAAS
jgi:acetaldehyde dehydrogenase